MPTLSYPSHEIKQIADAFLVRGELTGIATWAGGHINDSYLLEFLRMDGRRQFLLQKVNSQVFPEPEKVMENVARVTRFVSQRAPGLAFLQLIPTLDDLDWHTDENGDCWRLYPFIEGTTARMEAESADQAEAAAQAFGHFTRLLSDLPNPPLHEVIPGFHDTRQRIKVLQQTVKDNPCGRAEAVESELNYIFSHTQEAALICDLLDNKKLPMRVVHNDTKISNVLFDAQNDEVICVVDLDTVMPGSALFDFGDILRSMCSQAKEDQQDLSKVKVIPEYCDALMRGFLRGSGKILSDLEKELLPLSGFIIALELGARFLNDYLQGDNYFKATRPGQNLDRARVQLTLAQGLWQHFDLQATR